MATITSKKQSSAENDQSTNAQSQSGKYRFTRTISIANGTSVPSAVEYARHVCSYLVEHHQVQLTAGVELFGQSRIYWQLSTDNLDQIAEVLSTLAQDTEYLEMVERTQDLFLEGTTRDTVVEILS